MFTDAGSQLDDLLRLSIEALDISDAEYLAAVRRYEAVGKFLSEYWARTSQAGGEIHSQGSMALGTVTRSIYRNDEIDLDAVCRRDLSKSSITKAGLKADVGNGLALFVGSTPEGAPKLEEGKRCWTLVYPHDPFHIDMLPSLPDPKNLPNGIILTDVHLNEWQFSSPKDYASWFRGVMQTELIEKRAAFKAIDVADVPDWKIKTTLQMSVQALKRHRDIFFKDDLENRTASIIITTLAARAYTGGGSVFDVLADVTSQMPNLVKRVNGLWEVLNPVQEKENFADRWHAHPEKAERFFEWMDSARADFLGLGHDRGMDSVLAKVAKTFGSRPAEHAARVTGSGLLESRRSDKLAMATGTGMLTQGTGRRVRTDHHFHGDP